MKNLIYATLALGLLSQSCQEKKAKNYNNPDSTKIEETKVNSVADTAGVTFLQNAYSSSLFNIKIAELIKAKSVDNGLKAMGDKILLDHKKIVKKLESTIDSIGVAVDTSISTEQLENLENLNSKKGVAFDKMVLSQLLESHRKELSNFSTSEKNITNPVIKKESKIVFREISIHYEMFRKLNKRIKASVDPGAITNGMETLPLK